MFSVMDRNLTGFKLGEQEGLELARRYAVRAEFTADGKDDSALSGVAVLVASDRESTSSSLCWTAPGAEHSPPSGQTDPLKKGMNHRYGTP